MEWGSFELRLDLEDFLWLELEIVELIDEVSIDILEAEPDRVRDLEEDDEIGELEIPEVEAVDELDPGLS